jgi:alpha-mannosidase
MYRERRSFEVAALHVHGEPIPAAQALTAPYEPFAVGQTWGGRWDTTWFRLRARIPSEWAGAEVAALIHLGGDDTVGFTAEGLIWDTAGRPVQGLHDRHREHVVTRKADGGEEVELYVEAAANPTPPWHLPDWPYFGADYSGRSLYRLGQAELAVVDRDVLSLYFDMYLVLQLAEQFSAAEATAALQGAVRAIDPANVARCAARARALLAPVLAASSRCDHLVTAIGHAHIDTAWLWPLRETRRKCARTFASQLRLLDRYPEHRFACSQAVHYQWMKDDYPDLYAQIAARVAEGRWLPVGGMWVEPDCNIPSGESLVRQIVYGKRFFIDEFGVETRELWIPDVFGYSAALPQIAMQAGITALVTQKLSWNDTNVFPHSTFWWEGHDGSCLLAHFPPANTYNGDFSVGELVRSQQNFRENGRSDRSLYLFGYGDGGGGPTAGMLEFARRMAGLQGLPRVEIGTAASFFDRARQDRGLATWVGELYLERHRATFTTHADVKWANRRGEEALRAAEMWSVAAGIDRRAKLEEAWRLLLLHQFHDILPGSSIYWVYEDAARDHAAVLKTASEVIAESQAAVVAGGEGVAGSEDLVAFNPASTDRREVAQLPDGRLAVVAAPACGWATLSADYGASGGSVEVGEGWMTNGLLQIRWDAQGVLSSVRDMQVDREVLADGEQGNLFQLHPDHPQAFDAWDVDRSDLEHADNLLSVEGIDIVERHPLRAGVRFTRRFGASTIIQTMRLSAHSRRVEFHTTVDWRERHRFLKVAFPVAIRSSRATYEIQHGHLERPTVVNTSWDEARFEVCGHRWADLSEAGYGVALLNDGKYGYDIRGHVMRLSLLRAPGYPDPEADQGEHRFAYALLPHPGPFQEDVIAEAEAFNLPLSIVPGRGRGQVLALDRPGVSVEAVKWADRAGGVVVRLCEVRGGRGPIRVTPGLAFTSVTKTDLLERDVEVVPHNAGTVTLQLRPFELVTLRFA